MAFCVATTHIFLIAGRDLEDDSAGDLVGGILFVAFSATLMKFERRIS